MNLKVAGGQWWPFTKVISNEINGKNVTILDENSLMGNIMNTLSNKLNFNFTLSYSSSWGIKDHTAKYLKFNGMVGMLQHDKVDLAMGPFEIEKGDRYLVADPSTIIIEEAATIISSDLSFFSKNTLGVSLLTNSFETNVWYCILFTLFSIILIYSFANYTWANKFIKITHLNRKNFNEILIRNIFEFSGNLLKQYNDSNSYELSGILQTFWKLTSYLLILFYSSMILAHLIASNKKYIETFEDLANAEVITTTEQNTSYEMAIREHETDALKRIYSKMEEKGIHNCLLPHKRVFSKGIMSDILLGKRALIYSLSAFKSYISMQVKQKQRCGFYLAELEIDHVPHFMLYNKKFNKKLKDKIDLILLEIFERKPFDWKMMKYYARYEECLVDKTNTQWKSLILSHIRGLLLVCMIIISLAFILLCLEIWKKKTLLK